MAIGTWEDFTDKYGFEDGATTDQIDFLARSHIVEALNTHPVMLAAKVTAVEWDRPGMHNGCMILVFPNPDSLSTSDLLQKFLTEPYFKQCELPDEVLKTLSETISEAYAEAQEDSDLTTKDNDLSARLVTAACAALATLRDVHDTHIFSNNDPHPPDCCYCAIANELEAALKALPAETPNTEPVPRKPYVIVTVSGGVAELAKGGESADVDIIDFDNIRADYERAAQELSAPELNYLREHDSYTYDKLKPYLEPKP